MAALGVVGIQTASANEQRRRGLARASEQQSQPWSAEHVSAAVPSPRGSRPRKHWCPSAVKCGHLSVAAEKVYTTPQPPVHDILCYVLTAFYNIMCSVNLRTVYVVVEEFFHVFDYRDYAYFVVTVMYI